MSVIRLFEGEPTNCQLLKANLRAILEPQEIQFRQRWRWRSIHYASLAWHRLALVY
jgi:hypothetical protein